MPRRSWGPRPGSGPREPRKTEPPRWPWPWPRCRRAPRAWCRGSRRVTAGSRGPGPMAGTAKVGALSCRAASPRRCSRCLRCGAACQPLAPRPFLSPVSFRVEHVVGTGRFFLNIYCYTLFHITRMDSHSDIIFTLKMKVSLEGEIRGIKYVNVWRFFFFLNLFLFSFWSFLYSKTYPWNRNFPVCLEISTYL